MRFQLLLLICSLANAAFSQNIQNILDRNPFDPDRGKVEGEVATELADEVIPVDLPVLDGTIIAGSKRIALFTYVLEGKPTSARVTVSEKVAQYTVMGIERHQVKLSSSEGGEPIEVDLYSGQKESRGGTKKLVNINTVAKANTKKKPRPPNLSKNDPTQPRAKGKKTDRRIPPRNKSRGKLQGKNKGKNSKQGNNNLRNKKNAARKAGF